MLEQWNDRRNAGDEMKVVVVGAGVIGASLAYRLAQAGVAVTIVDRSGPAYGTTSGSFAWINANSKVPEDYFALNLAGMVEHRRLRDELGGAPWLHDSGNLVWLTDGDAAAELEARTARLQAWNYPAETLSRSDIAALEPHVQLEPEFASAALFPTEGWIDGPGLVRDAIARAAEQGATLRIPAEVMSIDQHQGRVTGIVLANGERIEADLVVNCAGPWADTVAARVGRTLPLAPTLGLTVRVTVETNAVSRVIHGARLHLRPDGDGLVMLHHHDGDAGVEAGDPPQQWAHELIERARSYVPALGNIRLSRWTVVTRPIPADERTSAGLVESLPGYAEVVTHSGITLGPLLGRLVANEITTGDIDPLLAQFSPERWG